MRDSPTIDRATEYQTLINGQLISVSDLTLEQAKSALCDAYDLIDALDEGAGEMKRKIEQWQNT